MQKPDRGARLCFGLTTLLYLILDLAVQLTGYLSFGPIVGLKNFIPAISAEGFEESTDSRRGQGTYQIIAACYSKIYDQEDDVFKYYQYAGITDEEQFNEYVAGVKAISGYDTGVTAEYGDQLVTLSTCAYQTEEGRFFIVGKRIDAKQQKPQF